ncbi:hypothetical protein [Streptomyces sp. 7N604]|uniref:hypothetical protein n=1 Tax=Streptomyces sp. 7N604 TaxID=3457415 RepID=UPI003FD63695
MAQTPLASTASGSHASQGSPASPGSPGSPGDPVRTSIARRALRTAAIAACLPYLSLKIAWISGSHLGIPEGSSLRNAGTGMALANGLTVLMDGCVIVLALLLTRPWGQRTPAWLLLLPVWVGTGLLVPIMTGYPLQLLVKALGGSVNTGTATATGAKDPFLDEWVFGVVYGGFIVQGLALGALFVLYARDRWGHLWRGPLGDLPASPTRPAQQAAAVAAALLALLPLTMHLLWACGSNAGLSESRAGERASDFYALEAVFVLFALGTVAGTLMLAFRLGRTVPLRVPLALAWTGSSALACWGGWLTLSAAVADDPAKEVPYAMSLTYAVQVIVGMLVATIGAYFLAEGAGGRGGEGGGQRQGQRGGPRGGEGRGRRGGRRGFERAAAAQRRTP